ncbi:MAG: type I restriction-modification system subunit M [Planctomycetes bacterium]|nr:type I restriction-modification system subunit M [Planctomycetota bacterium]
MSKLTSQELNSYLWGAADILRGQIDSSDYKNYIFGFLFLKRLSDVFEEEAEKIEEREKKRKTSDAEIRKIAWDDPDEHQFFVPKRARWSEIRKISQGLGESINKACGALEDQNSALEGVLADIDFNSNKLGDARNRDSVLGRLVGHFSRINLRNSELEEPDMLGRAYEYLIEKFADDAGKKGGEFFTPGKVVQLIVELLKPKEGMRICDPTCGSGGMLIECAHYIERMRGNPKNVSLFGQEKNLGTWSICKMNMLLHDLPDAKIEKGDTIRDPKLVKDGSLMLFDRVIANPPFSLKDWGGETAANDGYGRFRYGIPPKTKGDFAFVQHMIATINGKGMVGVVMPHGVLFRGASEGRIRQALLEEDFFEAVIGLPSNLFYGTGIPAAVLILNRNKPKERKDKVLFIHAAEHFEACKNQNRLRKEDIARITETFDAYKDIERFARVVPREEIKGNDYNLNISRYVDITEPEPRIDVRETLAKLRALEKERDTAKKEMDRCLRELGYE